MTSGPFGVGIGVVDVTTDQLSLAVGAIGLSAILKLAGRNQGAQFVGHWVPTILILGLYNKLVKVQGSD